MCAVWRQVWLTAIAGVEPQQKNDQMERSSYYIFDTNTWEAVRKDNFVLHYDAIERAPNLPRVPPGVPPAPPAPPHAQ
jgi:CCR4-NOT transcription complex subunit 2